MWGNQPAGGALTPSIVSCKTNLNLQTHNREGRARQDESGRAANLVSDRIERAPGKAGHEVFYGLE